MKLFSKISTPRPTRIQLQNIKFGPMIEHVCLFKKVEPPNEIANCIKYSIADEIDLKRPPTARISFDGSFGLSLAGFEDFDEQEQLPFGQGQGQGRDENDLRLVNVEDNNGDDSEDEEELAFESRSRIGGDQRSIGSGKTITNGGGGGVVVNNTASNNVSINNTPIPVTRWTILSKTCPPAPPVPQMGLYGSSVSSIPPPSLPYGSNVSLESVRLMETSEDHGTKLLAVCTVLVRNMAFEKEIRATFSSDGWKTIRWTSEAKYIDSPVRSGAIGSDSTGQGIDRFQFEMEIDTRNQLHPDVYSMTLAMFKIEFAIRYKVGGREFWDNHGGVNHAVLVRESHEFLDPALSGLPVTTAALGTGIVPMPVSIGMGGVVVTRNGDNRFLPNVVPVQAPPARVRRSIQVEDPAVSIAIAASSRRSADFAVRMGAAMAREAAKIQREWENEQRLLFRNVNVGLGAFIDDHDGGKKSGNAGNVSVPTRMRASSSDIAGLAGSRGLLSFIDGSEMTLVSSSSSSSLSASSLDINSATKTDNDSTCPGGSSCPCGATPSTASKPPMIPTASSNGFPSPSLAWSTASPFPSSSSYVSIAPLSPLPFPTSTSTTSAIPTYTNVYGVNQPLSQYPYPSPNLMMEIPFSSSPTLGSYFSSSARYSGRPVAVGGGNIVGGGSRGGMGLGVSGVSSVSSESLVDTADGRSGGSGSGGGKMQSLGPEATICWV
ncbi:hypothetical protein HDU76_006226 [Blyttiomyces sp. JEL0837]|nr:hypothetical protein HDU76_006226 [Blyttiomyces sp. JEL0837]